MSFPILFIQVVSTRSSRNEDLCHVSYDAATSNILCLLSWAEVRLDIVRGLYYHGMTYVFQCRNIYVGILE